MNNSEHVGRGGPCTVISNLNKFEHVWEAGKRALYKGVGSGALYSGNQRQGPLWKGTPFVNKQTDTTQKNTFTTPLASGNNICSTREQTDINRTDK